MTELFAGFSGLRGRAERATAGDHPLVICLHGGSYSSAYFDIASYSPIERADALGVPILAPDRPGYGDTPALAPENTPALAPEKMTLQGNADLLTSAIGVAWERHRGRPRASC